jgi:hypothetical protein
MTKLLRWIALGAAAATIMTACHHSSPAANPKLARIADPGDVRIAPATVLSTSPSIGSTKGGDTVIVKGWNLSGVKALYFGSTKTTNVRAIGNRELEVVTPPHQAGRVYVSAWKSLNNSLGLFRFVDVVK